MPNPQTPAAASSSIPPPVLNLPWGEIRDGAVYLNITSFQFLQTLWASIAGSGGVVDLTGAQSVSAGEAQAIGLALIEQTRAKAASPNLAAARKHADDVSLLARRPRPPISLSALLATLQATQGSIVFCGANGWQVLSPGTAGQFLETQGIGANPQWAAQGSAPVTTFAGLPASPTNGQRGFISDGSVAAAGNFGVVAAGGGGNDVPVYFDAGAGAWRIG